MNRNIFFVMALLCGTQPLLPARAQTNAPFAQSAYIKAGNTNSYLLGNAVALSGNTMVVGCPNDSADAPNSGAAYVYVYESGAWRQEAFLKASNVDTNDHFGVSVAISGDTIVVGANAEGSNATGVNGDQTDNSLSAAGAAYVFVRSSGVWTQQAYLKSSTTRAYQTFGVSVAISGDIVVVGAEEPVSGGPYPQEQVYVFKRANGVWSMETTLSASNGGAGIVDKFGRYIAISGDTLVVGAHNEASSATGVNGNEADNSTSYSGAAYVFQRTGASWTQQAYLKASNTGQGDVFGMPVAIDGDTIVVGAYGEDSNATGVNGNQSDNSISASGAAYVFQRTGTIWAQQAYLKASNPDVYDLFGVAVAINGDTVAVGAYYEDSNATGINGNQTNNSASAAGAAYVFQRKDTNWTHRAYVKASNTALNNYFGCSVGVSGNLLAVGASNEKSPSTGINGSQVQAGTTASGAVYAFQSVSSAELVALEAVQVVQDWHNSVPLINGKRTIVRAHIQTTDTSLPHVAGVLHGSKNGSPLPGSPLRPINASGEINATTNADEVRVGSGFTLNFQLPVSWLSGTVELEFAATNTSSGFTKVINHEYAEAGGTAGDGKLQITFTDVPLPKLRALKIRQELPDGNSINDVSDADVIEAMQRLKATLPIIAPRYTVNTMTIPTNMVSEDHKTDINLQIATWAALRGGTRDANLPPGNYEQIHLGILRGPDIGGLANGVPGSIACGTLSYEGTFSRNTIPHEIGHCLGRPHAVHLSLGLTTNGWLQGLCGEVAGVDAESFPLFAAIDLNGRIQVRPALGPMTNNETMIYGLDTHQLAAGGPFPIMDPKWNYELMSYCGVSDYIWPSVHTYTNMMAAIISRFGTVSPAPLHATKMAVAATNLLMIRGSINVATDATTLYPFLTVPNGEATASTPGNYTLQVLDATNGVLNEITFEPSLGTEQDSDIGTFLILVPANPAIQSVRVVHNGTPIAMQMPSTNAPTVHVLNPNGGETLAEPVNITWEASDPDGDALTYTVQYSPDGGATWNPLVIDHARTNFTGALKDFAGTTSGLIRVLASDGFHTATDDSDATFNVPNNAPTVVIAGPSAGQTFVAAQAMVLSGEAVDLEDGLLDGTNLQWSSNLDGYLGAGNEVLLDTTNLSMGAHIITVVATDSSAGTGTGTVQIVVASQLAPDAADLVVDIQADTATVPVGSAVTLTITARNDGPAVSTNVVVTNTLPDGVTVLAMDQGQQVNNTLVIPLGTLQPGDVKTNAATLRFDTSGMLTNTVSIGGDGPDPLPVNNQARIVITVAPAANTWSGDLDLGTDAILAGTTNDRFRVGGSFNNATTNTAYDLSGATFEFTGPGAHNLEQFSRNLGPCAGSLANNWSFGTLVTSGSVTIVDHHPNSEGNDAVYVQSLSGAGTLNIGDGMVVYYGSTNGWGGTANVTGTGVFRPYLPDEIDSDGDGVINIDECACGTDPSNTGSLMRIIAMVGTNNGMKVIWTTVGGRKYRLQSGVDAGGFSTNLFTDTGALVTTPGSGESSTNQFDLGGASNAPSRFYRIKLVP